MSRPVWQYDAEMEVPRLMKVKEAAQILNVSKTKAYAMVSAGVLPSIRMDGSVRVPYEDLVQWIKRNTTGGDVVIDSAAKSDR